MPPSIWPHLPVESRVRRYDSEWVFLAVVESFSKSGFGVDWSSADACAIVDKVPA